MGPDFVPPPLDNETTAGQESPYRIHTSPCLIDENPSTLGMNETGPSNSNVTGLAPESIYGMTTSYTANESLDNAVTSSSLTSTLFNCNEIDNGQGEYNDTHVGNTSTTTNTVVLDNDFTKTVAGSKTLAGSTESIDSVSSSSSGEIFNSEYTDTVSSTTSSAFLIKSSLDSDEEGDQNRNIMSSDPSCYNDGYMSYSSTEVLNDESDDNGSRENLLVPCIEIEAPEMEETPILEKNNDCSVDIGQSLSDFQPHPLSPIKENEVVSFITEVEPSQYTRITDNIIVVDESFLFNSNTNLGEMENRGNGKRAVTMQNLHERSSFLDLTEISKVGKACQKALVYLKDDITMGSLVSLNTAVAKEKNNNKDPFQSLSLISGIKTEGVLKKSSSYTKNLLALSLSVTLLYVAVGSVRNLQSSINHEGGVGVIGLAFNFVGYVLGSMFSSSIVQSFQPRRCLIGSLFPNLFYIAANLYPAMWVMVPISLVQGVSLAIVGNAVSTYITHLARGRVQKTKETFAEVSCRFFGTYSLMYISHLIIGNLIASLILQPPSASSQAVNGSELVNSSESEMVNNTVSSVPSHLKKCGPNFCQHFEIGGGSQFSIDMETKYLLFGVYFGCIIMAIVIAICFMEPLNTNLFRSTVSPIRKLRKQMMSLTKFFTDVKFILLLPLLMQSVMQFAFVTAEFAKGYITCALGMHMIGYTMICFGVCSSLSSFICGLLNKYVGRIPFIIAAATLNLGCLIYMLQWLPTTESLIPYFIIMGLWGIGDGFWTAQVTSLMGLIFPDKIEEAYAGLRITQGLGAAITFGYSSAFCMAVKIYITVGICSLGLVGYLLVEVMLKRKQYNAGFVRKQTSV